MVSHALTIVDQYGAEAYRLGWTGPQLFGVHQKHSGRLHLA